MYVGDGAGDQLTGDSEPLLPGCRSGPFIEAIKDGTFRKDAVEEAGYQIESPYQAIPSLSQESEAFKIDCSNELDEYKWIPLCLFKYL